MENKETLSDKILYLTDKDYAIHIRDIKEFIRKLKLLGDNKEKFYDMHDKKHYIVISTEDINKLAGEKLIWKDIIKQ